MTTFSDFPTADQLDNIKDCLRRTIQRRIIDDLVRSDTIHRIKEIRASNAVYFNLWPMLYKFAERAMIRVRHLEIVKRNNWSVN